MMRMSRDFENPSYEDSSRSLVFLLSRKNLEPIEILDLNRGREKRLLLGAGRPTEPTRRPNGIFEEESVENSSTKDSSKDGKQEDPRAV